MLIQRHERESLNCLFQSMKLKDNRNTASADKRVKVEQILSYLEIIHSQIRKYSKKRELVFIDSCAGNCYLSFLVYHYYKEIDKRPVTIHCVDKNEKLMKNGEQLARQLGYAGIHFHAADVLGFTPSGKVSLVYSLHACDTATDKTLYLGMTHNATAILSVSCCQHSIEKRFRNSRYRGITKHSVFKNRMVYMVGDSLRALLLEREGYKADIFEFTSSRHTDKNIMIRARKVGPHNSEAITQDYEKIKEEFRVTPALERYLLHN